MPTSKRKSAGRSKAGALSKSLVTRRIRRLIDLAHAGNIREASEACGLPYTTLRDLYRGTTTSPRIDTLARIAWRYGFQQGWFIDENQGDAIPLGGWHCLLPPGSNWPKERRYSRDTILPYGAWPLNRVYVLLRDYLDSLKPSPSRPIVGDTSDEREFNLRLAGFLFAPLISASVDSGERDAMLASPQYHADMQPYSREETERWLRRLRPLGQLWEGAIPDLLSKARQYARAQGKRGAFWMGYHPDHEKPLDR
ncbi:MAG TPA: hypothetical protein VGI92_05690 [Gemmatimonadales bacterium]